MNQAVSAQTIIEDMKTLSLPLELLKADAPTSATIFGISSMEDATSRDLVFMDKKDYLSTLLERKPAAVVTSKALANLVQDIPHLTVFIAPNVALAHALIKTRYAPRDFSKAGWGRIHPSSVIHETAEIHETASVEPRAVIGARVKIGAGSRVMAGVVIENDATIGSNTILHPSSTIGYGCVLGNEVVVGSGTVIGSEGYGFAQDATRKSYPIPQTGIVVIEDRVRLGANCCIDRAAYRETRIGAGTKLDNLCHVAHNVEIGRDCLLTAMLCVAGSTKIGNRVITSGQTGIIDHVTICDDAVLLHRAGVTKDVEKPGAYAGLPLQTLTDYMKNSAVMRNAVELKRRVSGLEAKAGTAGDAVT